MKNNSKVAVLVCTYNGSKYIRKQLDSIINQSYTDWTIYASDDGSTDSTLDILNEYQASLGVDKLKITTGPIKGFSWNFISLLYKSGDDYAWYALCDQDDEWMPEKLAVGINSLKRSSGNKPAIYCGRTLLVDEHDNFIGKSPLFVKTPSLENALVQSIAGGNTMILNVEARNLLIRTPNDVAIVSHDWWFYIVVTAAGGEILYDPNPTVRYRQHDANLVGSNLGWMARSRRLLGLFDGHFQKWNDTNLIALSRMNHEFTAKSKLTLDNFITARKEHFFKRIIMFKKLGLYRQTMLGTLMLFVAVVLNKI